MKVVLVAAFLTLLAAPAQSQNRPGTPPGHAEKPDADEKSRSLPCHEKPRPVLLETGIHIDLVYCGDTPDMTTTVGQQEANYDGKFYTIISHNIRRDQEAFSAYFLIYKPNADWPVPAQSLDSIGALILKEGNTEEAYHSGWVAQKDFRLIQGGHDWLQARQIVMQRPSSGEWVYYRIIVDTRHNLLYVLYQRDDAGGVNQENSFFDSFTVDSASFTIEPRQMPGAHLPPPYPNI